MKYTFGLDNGREVDVEAPSYESALLEIASAYPGAGILGFTMDNTEPEEEEATETTDTTDSE